jgi:peptide/nickel transport system permease protein
MKSIAHRSPFIVSLAKRLAWGVLTLWGVSLITFALLFIAPRLGKKDPARTIAEAMGGAHTDEATVKNIIRERGLDRPLYEQYFRFVADAVTGNLKSYRNSTNVMQTIAHRLPATLLLAAAAVAVWLIVAIPLGLLTAKYSGGWFDRASLFLGIVAVSIPTFVLGPLLQHYLGYRWGVFSVGGEANLWNLPLPALTLGLGGAAYYARLLHSNLGSVLRQDFIRSARARGLSESRVLGKHALKSALIPLVAILGMETASLLSGLSFTERIFGWPGIGSLVIDSILNLDPPMIIGTVLFSALVTVLANIGVDLIYGLIDPRVRVE